MFVSRLRTSFFLLIAEFNAMRYTQTLDKHVVADSPSILRTRKFKDSVFNSEGKKLVELSDKIGGIVVNVSIPSICSGKAAVIDGIPSEEAWLNEAFA